MLSGHRTFTFEFCVAIAKAFGKDPVRVLRIAKLLPSVPEHYLGDLSEEEINVIELMRGMTPDERIAFRHVFEAAARVFRLTSEDK